MPDDSLIEYPCHFPIKVMGLHVEQFHAAIVEAVLRHAPDFDITTVECRPSREGRYLSLTCRVNATSREHLDNLYRELSAHPLVKLVL